MNFAKLYGLNVSLHRAALQYTVAAAAAESGIDLHFASRLSRHSFIATTEMYMHATDPSSLLAGIQANTFTSIP